MEIQHIHPALQAAMLCLLPELASHTYIYMVFFYYSYFWCIFMCKTSFLHIYYCITITRKLSIIVPQAPPTGRVRLSIIYLNATKFYEKGFIMIFITLYKVWIIIIYLAGSNLSCQLNVLSQFTSDDKEHRLV